MGRRWVASCESRANGRDVLRSCIRLARATQKMALHLVTGGAGFIGSSIAETLLKSGDGVRILDDFSSGRRENLEALPGRYELIEGSVGDPDTVARAVRGVDV